MKDNEIVSPYAEDNEDIWQGDAVEIFLSPDGDTKRYRSWRYRRREYGFTGI